MGRGANCTVRDHWPFRMVAPLSLYALGGRITLQRGQIMEFFQAFLLGIMVALTPSLIVLAALLRNVPVVEGFDDDFRRL